MKSKLLNIFQPKKWIVLVIVCLNTISNPAQIVYNDIEPDFTSENLEDYYDLDLNNDKIVDYVLYSFTNETWKFLVISSFENSVNQIIAISPWYTYAVPLESNKEIFNLSGYGNGENYKPSGIISLEACYGTDCYYDDYDWKDKSDRYLGLRFLINGLTHYGWARLEVTSPYQWIIKDYAYNETPNEPIFAGQMVLDLEESYIKNVKVIVSNGQISILYLPNRTKYNLYTLNGQKIGHGDLEQGHDQINALNLSSGLYLIELIDKKSISSTKLKIIIP
ncbi:T9SS type A sorting domain-containing protein [Mariniflexile sp. HNIBRBA6329]|uniref:T9SS type A sorting domain-containing protein n=1 Tax=Mariniflexile sp. HNIBRBA6329 TaxID=3373088 RepID=UPI003746CE64